MIQVSDKGYTPSTPSEIREELLEKCKAEIIGFEERPADLNNNLINEAVIACSYVENAMAYLYNSQSPSYANETLFEQFAAEQGLRRKGAYPSYVELKIKGNAYTIIPKDTEITDENNSFIYKVEKEALIGSTGEILVNAYCEQDGSSLKTNTLTKFVNEVKGLGSVTNITPPAPATEIEAFDKFKKRVQAIWRSPRAGTYDYLEGLIKSIDGVIDRSVSFKTLERYVETHDSGKKYFNSAELVVLGGDSAKIAEAMYKGGGITSFAFRSFPSDNDMNRKIQHKLFLGNSVFTYEFTRPKKRDIEIEVKLILNGLVADSDSIQMLTLQAYENHFNTLQVGAQINKLLLQALFFEGFKNSGSDWVQVNQIDFKILIDNEEAHFNENGFLKIAFDEMLELKNYVVSINK